MPSEPHPSGRYDRLSVPAQGLLAGQGPCNEVIERQLFIAASTVIAHLARIFAKLGVTNPRGLAAQAALRGEQPTDDEPEPAGLGHPDPAKPVRGCISRGSALLRISGQVRGTWAHAMRYPVIRVGGHR